MAITEAVRANDRDYLENTANALVNPKGAEALTREEMIFLPLLPKKGRHRMWTEVVKTDMGKVVPSLRVKRSSVE